MNELYDNFQMIMSGGLAGFGFVGADIPGFWGNPEIADTIASYQLGVFNPFFRAHSHLDNKRREPWVYSQREQNVIRESIFLRYSLIHVVYNLFCEYSCSGAPIVRPVWMEFPEQEQTFGLTDRFMFGSDIYVAPKMKKDFLYDIDDPDEVLDYDKKWRRGSYNDIRLDLPGSPKELGGLGQVLWYDFQSSDI